MTCMHHHWKTSAKNQCDDVLETQWLYYRLTDLQGSPVPPIITHAAFSCLWFCQSWMFGFRLSMLDICLQAELFFVVHFPPSKHLSHLSWPDKYLKSYSHHFPGLGLSNTEESLSISNDPQEGMKALGKGREVLGEAKNCNYISQAYRLCFNSQIILLVSYW